MRFDFSRCSRTPRIRRRRDPSRRSRLRRPFRGTSLRATRGWSTGCSSSSSSPPRQRARSSWVRVQADTRARHRLVHAQRRADLRGLQVPRPGRSPGPPGRVSAREWEARAPMLGDVGINHPYFWERPIAQGAAGGPNPPRVDLSTVEDAVVTFQWVTGGDAAPLAKATADIEGSPGVAILARQKLHRRRPGPPLVEPFGFLVDGLSRQPVPRAAGYAGLDPALRAPRGGPRRAPSRLRERERREPALRESRRVQERDVSGHAQDQAERAVVP